MTLAEAILAVIAIGFGAALWWSHYATTTPPEPDTEAERIIGIWLSEDDR